MADRRQRPGVAEALAITGLGCVSALGRDVGSTRQRLFAGQPPQPRPPSRFTTDHPTPFPVFEVPDAWTPESAPAGRCSAFACQAVAEALRQSFGADAGSVVRRVGVSLGTVIGAALDDEDYYAAFRAGRDPGIAPFERFLASTPAPFVRQRLGLSGPCLTVTTACTSGALAIAEAAAWVRDGLCEVAVAGGAEKLSWLSYNGFASLLIASPEPCRPFDLHRQGLSLGEGAGVVVLERADTARARSARILGWLQGDSNACDAYHLSRPAPDGRALRVAMQEALETSAVDPAEVAFVNAHGTGTADNDAVEARVFSDVLPGVPFISTKGLTGHLLGAGGGLEAVLTLLCLEAQRLPASAGFRTPDPACAQAPAAVERSVPGQFAVSTSVAYGGNNVVLVFSRGEPVA